MLWGSVSVYSIFSHRVLSNVECCKVVLPLPYCHSHYQRLVFSLPSNSSNYLRVLLQLRFLRLQSFSPSECQDKNPADQGVVVRRRACQRYLLCVASEHLGMTVFFQTWPNLLELAPGYLALWQTPLWKSNQVDLVCVSIAVVFG